MKIKISFIRQWIHCFINFWKFDYIHQAYDYRVRTINNKTSKTSEKITKIACKCGKVFYNDK